MALAATLCACLGLQAAEGFLRPARWTARPRVLAASMATSDSAEMRKNPSLYDSFGTAAPFTDAGAGSTSGLSRKPEVLSPAGGWDQMRAAVEGGADAVYFGLQQGFNARARASNFDVDELDVVMDYLHTRGVKGYVVINVRHLSAPCARPLDLLARRC